MTVYEEITHMEKDALAKWILKLLRADESFYSQIYCRLICEYRLAAGGCDLPNEEDCLAGKESPERVISNWLDSETQEKPYMNLRNELKKRNISIRKLALNAGIVPQSLYSAINGRSKFWPGWKKKVADSLKMDISDLFE